MTQVSEITKRESAPQKTSRRSKAKEWISLIKIVFSSDWRKFRAMNPEERFVRPQKEYDIPPFHQDMRYCTSNEPYLRPTRWCNPREPTVVAMANELGAYELSDYEFAEAAFWFVKNKMMIEFCSMDGAGATLQRGTGTCWHLINVFVALCRAAGIKARYKTYTLKLTDEILDSAPDERARLVQMLFNFGGTSEGEGEAYVDGKWVVAHVAMRPELYANVGLPITKFGEDSINFTFKALPGTIRRFESIPLSLGMGSKVGMRFASLPMEQANIHIQKRYVSGRKILEEAGGVEAYDQNARMKYGPSTSMTGLKDDDALIFEE
jgi:hypothetical protein